MRKVTLIVASVSFALAFMACDKTPTSPQQLSWQSANYAMVANDKFNDISISATNSCNGDIVSGTGNVHQVVQQTIDGNGGLHFGIKTQYTNIKLTGAPSGAKYVSNETLTVEENIGPGETVTENISFKLIGQGKTPNVIAHVLVHVTVNANGDVTSMFDKVSTECH